MTSSHLSYILKPIPLDLLHDLLRFYYLDLNSHCFGCPILDSSPIHQKGLRNYCYSQEPSCCRLRTDFPTHHPYLHRYGCRFRPDYCPIRSWV